jgi:hypothetical protein
MSASASTNMLSVKLLSGDILHLEVDSLETYEGIYHMVWENLSEEIRPVSIWQLNLMCGEELVPIARTPAVMDYNTVHLLLIDAEFYHLSFRTEPKISSAVHERHLPNQPLNYLPLHLTVIQEREQAWSSQFDEWHLYDQETDRYTDLVDVKQEWLEWRGGEEYELDVEIPPEKPVKDFEEMLHFLVQRIGQHFQVSLAGQRWLEEKLREEMLRVEERYSTQSYDWEGQGPYHEDEDEDDYQPARWADDADWM